MLFRSVPPGIPQAKIGWYDLAPLSFQLYFLFQSSWFSKIDLVCCLLKVFTLDFKPKWMIHKVRFSVKGPLLYLNNFASHLLKKLFVTFYITVVPNTPYTAIPGAFFSLFLFAWPHLYFLVLSQFACIFWLAYHVTTKKATNELRFV